MNTRRIPLFLERDTYRRRRIMDAARLLPVVGFVLALLPVLWTQGGQMGTAGEAIYLFALWIGLIVAAALMARPLRTAIRRDVVRPAAAGVPPAIGDAPPSDENRPGEQGAFE